MSARAFGICLGALASAAGVLFARPLDAAPVDLVIDCPGLSAELRASLEARARADLSMKRIERFHLSVVCDDGRAAVEFIPAGGLVSRREGALVGEPEDWVDRVLALVHEAAAVTDASELSRSVAEFSADRAPQEAAMPPTERAQPAEAPRQSAARAGTRPVGRPPENPTTLRLEPEVSVGVEVWTAQPLALVGPAVAVGLPLEPYLRIVPTVAAAWSTGSGDDVTVRRIEGGADAVLGERWWFGLGVRAAWLRFAPRLSLSPTTRTIFDPSLVARAGLSVPAGPGHVSVSAGVRLYAERRDVRIDGALTTRVPNVAAVAAVGYVLDGL
jgi:hypothetical protein